MNTRHSISALWMMGVASFIYGWMFSILGAFGLVSAGSLVVMPPCIFLAVSLWHVIRVVKMFEERIASLESVKPNVDPSELSESAAH